MLLVIAARISDMVAEVHSFYSYSVLGALIFFFLYFFYKLSAVKIQFLIAFVEIILKGRGI